MRELRGLLRLIRPANCLSGALATLLGAALTGPILSYPPLGAAIVVFLLVGAGNVINDWADFKIDCVNKPTRPLPQGVVGLTAAKSVGSLLAALAVLISLTLGGWLVALALGVVLAILWYAFQLKNTVVVGNGLVSLLSALAITYGGMANRAVVPTIPPTILVFLFVFAREILKTVEDYAGDRAYGVRTVAVVHGRAGALRLYYGIVLAFVLATGLYVLHVRSAGFLITAFLGVHVPLWYGTLRLASVLTQQNVALALRLTKGGFYMGLLALLLPALGL